MRRFYRLGLVGAVVSVAVAFTACAGLDNTGTETVAVTGTGPDLIESAVGDPPGSAAVGDSFPVSDTVENTGSGSAGASTTVYLLSLNGTMKAPSTKALTTRAVAALAAGGSDSSPGSTQGTIAAGTPQGTYYVLACADNGSVVTETSETNNCKASTNTVVVSAPDLTESNVSASPAVVDSLASISISDQVNDITMTGAGQSTTRYYFSVDNTKSSDDGFVRACVNGGLTPGRVVSPIAGGGSDAGTTSSIALCERDSTGLHHLTAGNYYVIACADELQVVDETDETDNCAVSATTIQVTVCGNGTQESGEGCDDGNTTSGDGCSSTCQVETPSDLIETAVSNPPSNVTVNGGFSVTDTVQNQGVVNAGASTTRYYLSLDQTRDAGDTLLNGSRAVPALNGGASSSGTVTVTTPAMNGGSYYLIACADDTNVVTESDETNNCLSSTTTVRVGGADLIVSAIDDAPSSTMSEGATFTINDSTKNQGLAGAGASVTQFYLTLDKIHVAPSTKLLGQRSIGPLGSGNTSAGQDSLTISEGTPAGTYFLFGCADHMNQVDETDETNNCRASTNSFTLTGPDLVEQSVSALPTSVASGGMTNVTETVANAAAPSPATVAGVSYTRFYISTDNVWTSADPLLRFCTNGTAIERQVPSLNGGDSSQGTTAVSMCIKNPTLQPVAAGSYTLFACADQHTGVAETNEKNNCTGTPITVTP